MYKNSSFGQKALTAFVALLLSLSCYADLSVMSYDVGGLYDWKHDIDHADWAYLPVGTPGKLENCHQFASIPEYEKKCLEKDWTESRVKLQVEAVASVILSSGQRPDLLVLQEIENEIVAKLLQDRLGYSGFVMSNCCSPVGANVAILYVNKNSLQIKSSQKYRFSYTHAELNPLTDVIKLKLSYKSQPLAIFAVLFPAQNSPAGAREYVARVLRSLVAGEMLSGRTNVIVAGNFNGLEPESPDPVLDILQPAGSGFLGFGATPELVDVHDKWKETATPISLQAQPTGTFFVSLEKIWNRQDRFLVQKDLIDGRGLEVDPKSYRIQIPTGILQGGFDQETGLLRVDSWVDMALQKYDVLFGPSDHLPISMTLKFKK